MTDILDMHGWAVIGKNLDDDGYIIEAECAVQPTACQKCGVIGSLYRHGPKPVTYRGSPIRGHSVRLLARVLFGKTGRPMKQRLAANAPNSIEPMEAPILHEPPLAVYSRKASLRSMLLRKHGNRCMSCHGVYEATNLYVTRMGPIFDGESEVDAALLCGECKVRFHTNQVMPHDVDST